IAAVASGPAVVGNGRGSERMEQSRRLGGSARPERTDRPGLGLVLCCAAFFLSLSSVPTTNMVLPAIALDFGVGVSTLQWIVGAYVLAFAGTMLLASSLADRY